MNRDIGIGGGSIAYLLRLALRVRVFWTFCNMRIGTLVIDQT